MPAVAPLNADDVRHLVEERLASAAKDGGVPETTLIAWRSEPRKAIPVISMPVAMLSYNPNTHRVRAQRTLDPDRDADLDRDPFGAAGQAYLHELLMSNPSRPEETDPAFEALKADLEEHGQNDPGIITRTGVLINGNTRRAALYELGQEHIRVGILPDGAGLDDQLSIELALQLRQDLKREYSFMNRLLAIEERALAGRPTAEIMRDFRMRQDTYDRSRWILELIREAIERSAGPGHSGLRLTEFENHKAKLEELHRAYIALKSKDPEGAEALREQRLLAIVMDKSKTDVRLIDAAFTDTYMKQILPAGAAPATPVRIPGTNITAPGPSGKVAALKELTDQVLQARAVELSPAAATPEELAGASAKLRQVEGALEGALDKAGKQGRVIKRRFAAADRLSDATEDVDLTVEAVAAARSTGNFEPADLEDALLALRSSLVKLAQQVGRGNTAPGEGAAWLKAAVGASASGPGS